MPNREDESYIGVMVPLFELLGRRSEGRERSGQATWGSGVQERSASGMDEVQGETEENRGEQIL